MDKPRAADPPDTNPLARPIEDLTEQVNPLRMHEHLSVRGLSIVDVKLNSDELLFLLTMLNDVHDNLIRDVRNEKLNANARKGAYDMALKTENMYHSIFHQLQLYGPTREDAN